jgi:LysR family nitrogen assimilation transcriptional regulator
MNLRQLRYFARVVEVGSITRAAEQLFVAQPALGAQIKSLEEALGIELLVRHSRGVSPTCAGQLLYERAQEILRLVEDTRRDVAAVRGPQRVRIALGVTIAVMTPVGRDVIIEARSEMPDIHLGLREEPSAVLVEALERDEVDLAVAYDVGDRPGLLRVPLIEEELLLVTAAAEAPAAAQVSFAAAIGNPLVLQTGRDVLRLQVTTTATRLALPLDIAYDVASNSVIKNLIARGGVASIMHFGTVTTEIDAGILAARRIVNPTLKRTMYLVRHLDRPRSQSEDRLLDLLGRILLRFVAQAGAIAHPMPALSHPLSAALPASREASMHPAVP